MSYPEESLYWKGRGMDSSQSEPVVSSNGQGEAPPTDRIDATRDDFAMAALAGILACTRDFRGATDALSRAQLAYKHADAMLKARQP